ncbi:PLDc N-terminal domain-containing protein [Isoalcanivorax beigongshangi]|uniref:PLDc N-terminal domain-containing protein n=1 Tax=Isoalcanivorax beigongshangi TaxID=3238810 RepID=A0ABV4AID8_9GAMM
MLGRLAIVVVYLLVAFAVVRVIQSNEKLERKILWILLVVLVPLLGMIIWALMGPGSPVARR